MGRTGAALMQRLLFPLVLALALLLCLAALWLAHETLEEYEHGEAYMLQDREGDAGWREGELLPLQEILQRLELPKESRILEVEREVKKGHVYYEIELLMPGGRVREFLVDPRTAEVVGMKEGKEPHETAAGGR
jgi:uncharacterized iron-regulated membrane protein